MTEWKSISTTVVSIEYVGRGTWGYLIATHLGPGATVLFDNSRSIDVDAEYAARVPAPGVYLKGGGGRDASPEEQYSNVWSNSVENRCRGTVESNSVEQQCRVAVQMVSSNGIE